MNRRSDEKLREILKKFNEDELHGLMFGLLPDEKVPVDLSGKEVARLMKMNPKGHY